MGEPVKAFEAGGTRMAKCSDCGEQWECTQFAWEVAMQFHKELIRRGEKGLSGVARCDDCQVLWQKAQDEDREDRYHRDVELFRRMRTGLASIEYGDSTRDDVTLFVASLPDDFRIEHNAAVANFRSEADKLFTGKDKKTKGKGRGFA